MICGYSMLHKSLTATYDVLTSEQTAASQGQHCQLPQGARRPTQQASSTSSPSSQGGQRQRTSTLPCSSRQSTQHVTQAGDQNVVVGSYHGYQEAAPGVGYRNILSRVSGQRMQWVKISEKEAVFDGRRWALRATAGLKSICRALGTHCSKSEPCRENVAQAIHSSFLFLNSTNLRCQRSREWHIHAGRSFCRVCLERSDRCAIHAACRASFNGNVEIFRPLWPIVANLRSRSRADVR